MAEWQEDWRELVDGLKAYHAHLEAQIDAARGALRKYGYHTAECCFTDEGGRNCDCGLIDAIYPPDRESTEEEA